MWLKTSGDGVGGWLGGLEELGQETAIGRACNGVLFLRELLEWRFLHSSVLGMAASWQG